MFRCIDPSSESSIHAFDLPADEWNELVLKNRKARHLRTPCCFSRVDLKRSRHGTQFFAHKRGSSSCTTAPEKEEHRHLKKMAVDAARANGWDAETEVAGTTPEGEQWIADVLATKGGHQVAVEIQWSGQADNETFRRQEKYTKSGVRGLWLLRRSGFPVTHDVPAARIGGTLEEGFIALLENQQLPMPEFLDAAFSQRFHFGIPNNIEATISIHGAYMDCWHPSCNERTRVLTRIDVDVGCEDFPFSVSELGEHPDLIRLVLDQLPKNLGLGQIKPRYSRTEQRSYWSNGCRLCDRLFGEFYLSDVWHEQNQLHAFPIRISKEWQNAIYDSGKYTKIWGVYPSAGSAKFPPSG